MELGQKRRACARQRHPRDDEQRERAHNHHAWVIEDARKIARKARLQHPRQPPVVAAKNRGGVRQEGVTQRRRHDNRDAQRCEQRDDVRERQGREEAAFNPRQAEDRQEHEHDDDRREHD